MPENNSRGSLNWWRRLIAILMFFFCEVIAYHPTNATKMLEALGAPSQNMQQINLISTDNNGVFPVCMP